MTEPATLDALEQLMARQRAIREFSAEPVDDALIERLIAAATRAPSAKNVQILRFVVVRDAALKQQLAALYDAAPASAPGPTPWEDTPALIFVCSEDPFGRSESGLAALAGSVYPGIQNLLLAVQAAGLGAVLTTSRAKAKESEIKSLLRLPVEMSIHAIIPIGWPARRFGKNRRRPVSEVAFRDRYDQPW
jgi:nitroreductase